jgi:molecular chaperone DnaK
LDSLIYSTEKSLKEYGGQLEAGVKETIEAALQKAKQVMESQDAQTIRSAVDELTRSSHKLAETIYAKASQQQASTKQESASQTAEPEGKKKEDVVDADFEEVKD